jgi:hypothetical protein
VEAVHEESACERRATPSPFELIGYFSLSRTVYREDRAIRVYRPQEILGRAVLSLPVSLPPPKTDSDAFAKIADILELPLTLRQRAIDRIHATKKSRRAEAG